MVSCSITLEILTSYKNSDQALDPPEGKFYRKAGVLINKPTYLSYVVQQSHSLLFLLHTLDHQIFCLDNQKVRIGNQKKKIFKTLPWPLTLPKIKKNKPPPKYWVVVFNGFYMVPLNVEWHMHVFHTISVIC